MARNDESNIGQRLGRLLQQFDLRIAFAAYKAEMYENERSHASMRGMGQKAIQAQMAKNSWNTYRENLLRFRSELIDEVKSSLIGYSATQKHVWFAYFMENKSSTAIAKELGLSDRTVERSVAKLKDDMALKFRYDSAAFRRLGEIPQPRWSAEDLAAFLKEKPSQEYLEAIKDMLDYGIIDLDALEFDHGFQHFLETGRRPTDGEQ